MLKQFSDIGIKAKLQQRVLALKITILTAIQEKVLVNSLVKRGSVNVSQKGLKRRIASSI